MKLTLKKKITYKAFSYSLETLTKKNALPTFSRGEGKLGKGGF
jgi:hypothetical protein